LGRVPTNIAPERHALTRLFDAEWELYALEQADGSEGVKTLAGRQWGAKKER